MYHRFHAPHDCRVEQVTYVSGRHLERQPGRAATRAKLFCKNERAVLRTRLAATGHPSRWCRWRRSWSPASGCISSTCSLHLRYRGPNVIPCEAPLRKGEEMGWFQHGSTIIVFAPAGLELCPSVREGGCSSAWDEALFRLP